MVVLCFFRKVPGPSDSILKVLGTSESVENVLNWKCFGDPEAGGPTMVSPWNLHGISIESPWNLHGGNIDSAATRTPTYIPDAENQKV